MAGTVVQMSSMDRLAVRLVYRTRGRTRGGLSRQLLRLLGVDIPPSVKVGEGLLLPHVGAGHTVHWNVTLGRNVVWNPGVCIGRADLHGSPDTPAEVVVGDDVVIGANACVMARGGTPLILGDGAVLGAGSVLTRSIPTGEVWAGQPARRVRPRSE